MREEPKTHTGQIATVLVPIDFSAPSIEALHYAAALVTKVGAQLHVVHVSETDFSAPGPSSPDGDPTASDAEIARLLKQRLEAAGCESLAAIFHGRTGRAFDQICRLAREIKVDLIVMSTHGRTGLKRLFLGSNAERVVQHSSSPVLVVRQGDRERVDDGRKLRIQTILVPTDFSASSKEGLSYAVELAGHFGARVILFHSFTIPEILAADPYAAGYVQVSPEEPRTEAEEQMQEFVKQIDFRGVPFETEMAMGHPAEEICGYAEQQKVDLIVTSTHGRTGLMHVLIGSVAEHIVRYAHTPVLVVPGSIKRSGLIHEASES